MGTNYYRMKKITENERQSLHDKLNEFLDNKCNDWELTETLDDFKKGHAIHICKISRGWQVCFDHNWGKYYNPNRKSLEKFLTEKDTYIEDEYGRIIEYDDFWNIIETHNKDPFNKWTSKSYTEFEKSKGIHIKSYCSDDIKKCGEIFGVDTNGDNDFNIDGLRFAVYSDFS